jgi:hypothetical protein
MPCHHSLDAYLGEYIDAADVADEPKGWLFRSTRARSGELTGNPLSQADVYRMIRRRALAAPQRFAVPAPLRTGRHVSVPAFERAA